MVRRFILVVSLLLGVMALIALASPAGASPPTTYTAQLTATEGNNALVITSQTLESPKDGASATLSATVTFDNPFTGAISTSSSSMLQTASTTYNLTMNPDSALKGGTFSFTEDSPTAIHSATTIKGTITVLSESAITNTTTTQALVTVSVTVK